LGKAIVPTSKRPSAKVGGGVDLTKSHRVSITVDGEVIIGRKEASGKKKKMPSIRGGRYAYLCQNQTFSKGARGGAAKELGRKIRIEDVFA